MKLFKTAARLGLAAFVLVFSSQTFAGKDPGVTGTLTIDTGSGLGSYSATPGGDITVSYGEDVTFSVVIEGRVSSKSRTYVTVVCSQDKIVFQASNWTDYTFTMSDLTGQGLDWEEGTAASRSASLIYREDKGRQTILTLLDEENFSVE